MTPRAISADAEAFNLAHLEAVRRIVKGAASHLANSPAVRAKARRILLDTLSCAFSGRKAAEMQSLELALAESDPGLFRLPGGPALSNVSASMVVAAASAWDEACEGLPYAHGRPALALVGALLPVAIERGASLDALIDSLIAGYETSARAGGWLRIRPGMHVDGNWPALGVAAGVGVLLGLSPQQRWRAVSAVACQLPASLYSPIRSGDDARNLYSAHAALLGLMAVQGARAGIGAPDDVLLEIAHEHAIPDGRPAPADSRAFILEAYFKPHAGVRHAHYGLEAAAIIRARLASDTRTIQSVHLRIYEEATRYAGNRNPMAAITGQFSLSLGVAAGLRFGGMRPELFRSEEFHDRELRRLERLVNIEAIPDAGATGTRTATLSVCSGTTQHQVSVDTLEGDPARPPTSEQLIDKFVRYSAGVVEPERSRAFAEALIEAPGSEPFSRLWAALS